VWEEEMGMRWGEGQELEKGWEAVWGGCFVRRRKGRALGQNGTETYYGVKTELGVCFGYINMGAQRLRD